MAVGGTAARRAGEPSAGRPNMTCTPRRWSRVARWSAGTMLLSLSLMLPARAIEMFTYFGDGSRIGLPSLEVPVQAYPGIPLRSDRLRARARAQQLRKAAASQPGSAPAGDGLPGIPGGGITVRPMAPQLNPSAAITPVTRAPAGFPPPPAPAAVPGQPAPPPSTNWSNLVPGSRPATEPVAPPQPTTDPGRSQTLPGFNAPVFPGASTNPAPRPTAPSQSR